MVEIVFDKLPNVVVRGTVVLRSHPVELRLQFRSEVDFHGFRVRKGAAKVKLWASDDGSGGRSMIEDMEQVRMTDAEVANDFAAVLEKLRHGAEVVVEQDHRPVAVISPVKGPGRPIDECIALAKAHGSGAKLDEEYAGDLGKIIASRRPLDTSVWD